MRRAIRERHPDPKSFAGARVIANVALVSVEELEELEGLWDSVTDEQYAILLDNLTQLDVVQYDESADAQLVFQRLVELWQDVVMMGMEEEAREKLKKGLCGMGSQHLKLLRSSMQDLGFESVKDLLEILLGAPVVPNPGSVSDVQYVTDKVVSRVAALDHELAENLGHLLYKRLNGFTGGALYELCAELDGLSGEEVVQLVQGLVRVPLPEQVAPEQTTHTHIAHRLAAATPQLQLQQTSFQEKLNKILLPELRTGAPATLRDLLVGVLRARTLTQMEMRLQYVPWELTCFPATRFAALSPSELVQVARELGETGWEVFGNKLSADEQFEWVAQVMVLGYCQQQSMYVRKVASQQFQELLRRMQSFGVPLFGGDMARALSPNHPRNGGVWTTVNPRVMQLMEVVMQSEVPPSEGDVAKVLDIRNQGWGFDVGRARVDPVAAWREMEDDLAGEVGMPSYEMTMKMFQVSDFTPPQITQPTTVSANKDFVEIMSWQYSWIDTNTIRALGRHKHGRAQILLTPGTGALSVTNKRGEHYTQSETVQFREYLAGPFVVTNTVGMYDVEVSVTGASQAAQAQAARQAISVALSVMRPELQGELSHVGFLYPTQKARESLKKGRLGARKFPRWRKK